jgi:hypothetical protein
LKGKWGYINGNGKIAINPEFEAAETFYKGFAAVQFDNKVGYIDVSRHRAAI